ncbi:MAG: hypothetical protein Q4P18_07800 [Methanobrevibacter sp.]|uniref:hypothetical protein n=1 Tax=Methanobrevibacter sp. TaxID=66852 RepID=UPI0026E09D30|nr:hypothetical protein [Methanobrevibacter sp.]MDO5849423.1 hypothetical protein [Methanobrevibacter sp.]
MQPGIIPAIISFFFPGLGQAITTGRPTWKWIGIFIIIIIVDYLLQCGNISWLGIIFNIVLAYDAYADKIQL